MPYELIGPYATRAELEHALDSANRESRKRIEVELLNHALDKFSPFRTATR